MQELLAASAAVTVTNWTLSSHRATEQEETGSSVLHTDLKELSDKPSNIFHTKLPQEKQGGQIGAVFRMGMALGELLEKLLFNIYRN